MKRLEAIKQFLIEKKCQFDISRNTFEEIEIQVNVAQDEGQRVERTFHFTDDEGNEKEIRWWGYTNCKNTQHTDIFGLRETWKSFRIPYGNKENNKANYQDKGLRFSIDHFEAIGLSGWNWVQNRSEWIGFDFDSIASHTQGLSTEELNDIRNQLEKINWVTSQRSTSGKGIHFYVYLDPPIPTYSHTEHAALARSILSIMSARLGKSLDAKVDVFGGILWIWHRRAASDGYTLLKKGDALTGIPHNWRDHTDVVSGKRKKIRPPTVTKEDEQSFENIIQKTRTTDLDDGHREIIKWLLCNNRMAWWNEDHKCLIAHTFDLLECHHAMKLKGPFYTVATGKEKGHDQNCFLHPLRNSGWVVRRHTRKTQEHPSWTIDSSGWTKCYFNISANLETASRCHEGVERIDGKFELPNLRAALESLRDLGAIITEDMEKNPYLNRPAWIKGHKEGRAILSILRTGTDVPPIGWYEKGATWERIVDIRVETQEIEVPDNFVRHVIAGGREAGWFLNIRNIWVCENDVNVRRGMIASGIASPKLVEEIRGQCVLHPWWMVNRPFQPEYPGNRTWNRASAQYAFEPQRPIPENMILDERRTEFERSCPTWARLLTHCAHGLDEAVQVSSWCKEQGLRYGREYLFFWVVSLFRYATEPLPYLFFHGPQDSGKSSFHEALALLFKDRLGYTKAEVALTNPNRFNAELINAVLCIVEETNVADRRKESYNRIKEWVTSPVLLVHEKGRTPFHVTNTTHWIQVANPIDHCPIFPGDTRIVMTYIPHFSECGCEFIGEKTQLMRLLENEGPQFLWWILNTEIPASNSRLRIPIIRSADFVEQAYLSGSPVKEFLDNKTYDIPGAVISLYEVYDKFQEWLPIHERRMWSYNRFHKNIPNEYIRGKYKGANYVLGNRSLTPDNISGIRLRRLYDRLIEEV